MLSSLQLARLVQVYLSQPGTSVDEKAARVGIPRNALLRAARGTISRSARARLLAHFATAPGRPRTASAEARHRSRKRGFT